MTNWRWVISAIMLLTATGCSASTDPSPAQGGGAPVEAQTFTATGVLTLALPLMSDSIEDNRNLCEQQMPVQPGHQITIENPRGEVVGFGSLEPIDFDPLHGNCRSSWTADDVPASSEVFSLLVGDGYEPIFRQAEGEAGLVSRFPDPAIP